MHADHDEQPGIARFIFYWMLFSLASVFISNGFKFAVYDLSGSERLVSLVGSVAGLAFITLGLVAGIVVSATSNRFFVLLHPAFFAPVSLLLYLFLQWGWLGVGMLFACILLHGVTLSLHSAAANRVFYDLCGTRRLSEWLSRRNMAVSAGSVSALLLLGFWVEKSAALFVVYALLLLTALTVFLSIPYRDSNRRVPFSLRHVAGEFAAFARFAARHRTVRMLFILSFMKTFFIYWAMSSGVLLKLGIDSAETRRLYLWVLVLMDGVSIAALYVVGRQKTFSNRDFLGGAMVSGAGILLFALLEQVWLAVAALSLMHIGFAICQMASGYVLRLALPERFRTQGISFAVIPYYFADIVSGLFFAALLGVFSVQALLVFSGGGLLVVGAMLWPLLRVDGK